MSSFGHIDALAHSRGKPVVSKRIANNTYAVRLTNDGTADAPRYREAYQGESGIDSPDAVGVKLHNTVVVTYTQTGELILNSGGWQTLTTKDRINSYTPNWVRVSSENREWRVYYRPFAEDVPSIPFADGVTLEINSLAGIAWTPVPGTYPDESQERLAREAKKKLRADIAAFVKKGEAALVHWRKTLTEQGQLSTAGDCWYCQGIVTNLDGSPAEGNDHLWSHLRQSYVFPTLYVLAYAEKGFRDPRAAFAQDLSFSLTTRPGEFLSKFLFKRLSVSAEPKVDVVRFQRYVDNAVQVLEKPEDFGYFGSDEHLWRDSAPTWAKHRDSENLEIANFQVVWNTLKTEFPTLFPDDLDEDGHVARDFNEWPAIYVFGAGHWAVGHIDQIVVPVKIDPSRPVAVDNLHPAFIRLCELRDEHESYPVLGNADELADQMNVEQITKGVQEYVEFLDDERVTPYAEKIAQWWIQREVLDGEEQFGYWTDDIVKAHVAITEEEAYAELATT